MAIAAVAPETVEITISGTSRARSAWLWTRALLHKAHMGIMHGVTKVQVTMTRALGSTAAAGAAAGAQVMLATRAGWDAGTNLLTKAIGVVAKGACFVARGVSWVMDKIGKGLGWFVGLFNKGAGDRIQQINQDFTNWRLARIEGVKAQIEVTKRIGHAAMTTQGVSTVGRISAGVMGVGTMANIATGGAVVAKASALPVIGKFAGLAFGPAGLLITGGIALVGGLFAWLFRRDSVNARLIEIETAAYERRLKAEAEAAAKGVARAEAEINNTTTTTNGLTISIVENSDGTAKMSVTGDPNVITALRGDPEAFAALADAHYTDSTQRLGGTVPLALEDITDEMVLESFKSNPVKPGRNNGTEYTQAQIDKRRGQIHQGTVKIHSSV